MIAPHDHPRGLREIQAWLAGCIVDPSRLDSAGPAAVLGVPPSGDLAARLHAYADGYPARIHESLTEGFPAVMHLVGTGQAFALTQRYIVAHPPRSFNLNHAGSGLVEFLRQDALTASLPFLPDLAWLEWLLLRAFHAEEQAPLDPARIAQWDDGAWASARIRFQPAVAVISSEWPLRDLHDARATPLEEIDIEVRDRPDHVLIRRRGVAVHRDGINATEARVLRALLAGQTLGAVMQSLADHQQDADAIGGWFARWMQQGLIVDIGRI